MATRRGTAALGVALLALAAAREARAQTPEAAPRTIAVGDWQLAPSLEVRVRGEARGYPVDVGGARPDGSLGPSVDATYGAATRARVGLGAERGALRAQVTLQDARVFGGVAPTAAVAPRGPASGALDAYEAYAEVRSSPAPRASFVRLGRQAVRWGDGLLLGAADWAPAGRALDAARGVLVLGDGEVEVLAVLLDAARPFGPGFGDAGGAHTFGSQLYGARAAWMFDPLLALELAGLARVARSAAFAPASPFTTARAAGETGTLSARVSGERGLVEYAVEGAAQVGDRVAWAAAAHATLRLDRVLFRPTLRAGGAAASGDDGGPDRGQFDPLLPDVHTRFGGLDAFAWSNLVEVHGRVTAAPTSDLRAAVELRYARLARTNGEWLNAYLQPVGAGAGGAYELGHELDVGVTWTPWPAFALHAGYAGLRLGEAARRLVAKAGRGALRADGTFGAPDLAHAGWLQATLRVP